MRKSKFINKILSAEADDGSRRRYEAKIISEIIHNVTEAIYQHEELLANDWCLSEETKELIELAIEETKSHLKLYQNRLNEVDEILPKANSKTKAQDMSSQTKERKE